MKRTRTILSIAHSYVVALNRRLAHEMAAVGGNDWEVVCVAPNYFKGSRDLRPISVERNGEEPCPLVTISAYLTSRVHFFWYGLKLRSLLRENWTLVHCWEEPYIVAGRQIAWWTPQPTRLVYTSCQNLSKSHPPPFAQFERQCLNRSAGWVGIGQTVVQTLQQKPNYERRPGRYIPLGVDTNVFCPNADVRKKVLQSLGWDSEGPPVVGYLGRFLPEKGLSLLMNALDSVPSDWRALFVGGGPEEASLKTWAEKHSNRVRICTGVVHDQVPNYLNAMDILCAPSQTTPRWREQFGRMLVEAFATGVSVIGSDSGEIPFVIGATGEVVGEADQQEWTNKLTQLLDSPQRRRELAGAGRERALAEFAWPVVARRYLDFFEEVLEKDER